MIENSTIPLAGASARPSENAATHALKCWPRFFDAIADGRKRHDLRRTIDRDFRVGDRLRLQEFSPDEEVYTGRELTVQITYITSAHEPCALSDQALHEDFCILSIVLLHDAWANVLVAATGLAGSGKTSSLEYLESIGVGTYLHVGGIVNTELAARRLAPTPENERFVREALRAEEGMAALAKRAAPTLGAQLNAGKTVLIDAVCNMEESEFYRDTFGSAFKVIAIDAPFETRAVRLESRELRPISRTQLIDRDRYELDTLFVDKVIADAEFTIENDGTKAALQEVLRRLAPSLVC